MTTVATPQTIPAHFAARVASDPGRTAIHVRRDGAYVPRTWGELNDDVLRAAAALVELGIEPGDRVLMVSPNRYEWIVADLAIQLAGGVHVPVHAALSGPQVVWQIVDSGAKVAILAGPEQVDKLRKLVGQLPAGLRLTTFDAIDAPLDNLALPRWQELLAAADRTRGEQLRDATLAALTGDSLATILYTSGTTGEPKGVMLSQRNIVSNAEAGMAAWNMGTGDLRMTWLPLSHIFARTCDLYTWIISGSELALADAPETVTANCRELHPTLLNGVPYFWEKVARTLVEKGVADQPGALPAVFGGRMRACISGGAALPDHVTKFYHERGIPLTQGYGLTESAPVIATGTNQHQKLGTVGRPLPGVEVKIADDGEILTRGPHVMLGYWKQPGATAETIRDGWLHTGDLGAVDDDGYLRITGRKKEIIVTAAGKNIAPAKLEALLRADELIEQVVVLGDGQKYLTALIVPNPDALRAAIIAQQIPVFSAAEALAHPRVRQLYTERIAARLSEVSRYEQVCQFTLLDRAFSVDRGEMTPKLSLRRAVICEHFAEQIAAMYRE